MVRQADYLPAAGDVEEIVFETGDRREKTDAEEKTDAFAEALKSDSEAFINVSRQTMGGNSPMEFVGRFPADKYDYGQLQVHLQRHYGGGDYRLMLYAGGKIRQNKLLSIATPVKTGVDNAPSTSGEVGNILGQIMERFERQNQALLNAVQSKGDEEMKFLEKMAIYKNLFDGGATKTDPIAQLQQSITLLQDLGVPVGGEKSEEDAGFNALLDRVSQFAVNATQNPQPAVQQNPKAREKPKMSIKMIMLKSGLKFLVKAASKNAERITYAESVLDQVPEEIVKEFIVAPGAFEKIVQIEPKAAPYKEWFLDLGEHVKAQLGIPSKYASLYGEEMEVPEFEEIEPGLTGEGESGIRAETEQEAPHNAESPADLHSASNT